MACSTLPLSQYQSCSQVLLLQGYVVKLATALTLANFHFEFVLKSVVARDMIPWFALWLVQRWKACSWVGRWTISCSHSASNHDPLKNLAYTKILHEDAMIRIWWLSYIHWKWWKNPLYFPPMHSSGSWVNASPMHPNICRYNNLRWTLLPSLFYCRMHNAKKH